MNPNIPQTSFIPKKPLSEVREVVVDTKVRRSSGLLGLFATLILIVSIFLAGGVFFFKQTKQKDFNDKKSQIQNTENSIDTNFLDEIKDLDKRIKASSELLNSHLSLSPLFSALGQTTLKSIQYTRFDYTISQNDRQNVIMIILNGVAKSYASIALQSDAFSNNRNIEDPVFSGLSRDDKTGTVIFTLTFNVNPEFVKYKSNIH